MLYYLFIVLSLAFAGHVDPKIESCLHINVNEYTVTSELTAHIGECLSDSLISLNENDIFHLTSSYSYKFKRSKPNM